ncbi:hypothetical protein SA6_12115 [Staphylococcus epidermidis]|nr:hypothetical protein SA6_12115 [Staphylococcus epidermidis]
MGMVGTRARHAGDHHIAVADRLDLLQLIFIDQQVEAHEDLVEQPDQFHGRHGPSQRGKLHHIGE